LLFFVDVCQSRPAIVGICVVALMVPINTALARCGAQVRQAHMSKFPPLPTQSQYSSTPSASVVGSRQRFNVIVGAYIDFFD